MSARTGRAPVGPRPYPRRARPRRRPRRGRRAGRPHVRLVAHDARAAGRLRGDRRAPRPGPGAGRGRVRRLRRVAALPGHHPARRPRLDLRPQRERPGRQPPAADDLGEPVADQAPARGGGGPRRSARPRRRRPATRWRRSWAATREFTYVARRVDDEVAAAVGGPRPAGHLVHRGAQALHAGRRPRPIGARRGGRSTTTASSGSSASTTTRSPASPARSSSRRTRTVAPSRAAPTSRTRPSVATTSCSRSIGPCSTRPSARWPPRSPPRAPRAGPRSSLAPRTGRDPRAGQLHDRSRDGRDRGHRQQPRRATAVYEPGSVNKVITVAAALEEGLVTPSTELDGARLPAGERPPLHRPRPAPHRELLRHADPHRVVQHRHHQAGADARQGPASTPTSVGSGSATTHRPRLPERGGGRAARPRATTTARRWAPSPSARASR